MMRRFRFLLLPICLIASPVRAADERSARPNIVLCMADDQGWGDVGCYDHPVLKTPNLDAMASAGLRFDRFYAAAPVCSPTRGSVLTGRTPNRFGCFKWGHTLRPQEVTLAEILRSAGYATGHFGKWHLGSVQKGSPVNPGASGFQTWLSAPNFFENDPILSRQGVAEQMQGESSAVTMRAALEFIRDQARRERPFLAVVWFGSPHRPHQAAKEDLAHYPDEDEGFRHFYGEITGIDRAMGTLREDLRRLDLHDETIVWYCSDNGGLSRFGRTGGRGHKSQIYEGGLRVPAIIEWPGRISPRITDIPATTSDILPTLVDLVGAKPPDVPLDGISLVPAIAETVKMRSRPIGFWDHPTNGIRTPSAEWMTELLEAQRQGREITDRDRLRLHAGKIKGGYPLDRFPGHSAWLDWPWKLHRIEQANRSARLELYNLEDDPMEKQDLADAETDRVATMRRELETWLVSVVQSLNGEDYPAR